MATELFDLVKGPQGDPDPHPYNVKFEDAARAQALEDAPISRPSRTATIDVTGGASEDLLTLNAHGMPDGTPIKVVTLTTTTGLTAGQIVYVRDSTTNTFRVATTPTGGAFEFGGSDGSLEFETPAVKALVGTPFVPAHYFDDRDGAVTADPVLIRP